jgi:exodeoxyribonuclease VII small subunit
MEKRKSPKEGSPKGSKKDFEKALKELEEIASRLEDGELGLEESIKQFEKGMNLARYCREKLDEAERKIEILQKGDDGKVRKKSVSVKSDSGEIENDDDLQGSLL